MCIVDRFSEQYKFCTRVERKLELVRRNANEGFMSIFSVLKVLSREMDPAEIRLIR